MIRRLIVCMGIHLYAELPKKKLEILMYQSIILIFYTEKLFMRDTHLKFICRFTINKNFQ